MYMYISIYLYRYIYEMRCYIILLQLVYPCRFLTSPLGLTTFCLDSHSSVMGEFRGQRVIPEEKDLTVLTFLKILILC